MNERLAGLGWRAAPVRGFIPPAVFTEMQARGVLAIAADIRTHEHVEYTPAPDIVHESAGHAPILKDPRYADYLKRCGVAGFRAIASREDRDVFEAIRALDTAGYAVIPPSGRLRDLTAAVPHILDRLGCRILHLLPVGPVPTN